jgi:asparagine synthetase B (glutamine-hydrolysing)
MCGIYGIISKDFFLEKNHLEGIFSQLWKQSEKRGREACGVALKTKTFFDVLKFKSSSSDAFVKPEFKRTIENYFRGEDPIVVIGHSRLQTNGERELEKNNQPVVNSDSSNVLIHNGIICNYSVLFENNNLFPETELDSEYLHKRLTDLENKMTTEESLKQLFKEIEGEATISYVTNSNLVLATNCGNLYYQINNETMEIVFASEKIFLEQINYKTDKFQINKLLPGKYLIIDFNQNILSEGSVQLSDFKSYNSLPKISEIKKPKKSFWLEENLRHCSTGILNENMPFITFNKDGVSNYAENFTPIKHKPLLELERELEKYRSSDQNKIDCIVGFSGGRDSSYLLHLLVKKYNMNPLAVTYDWGMVTDLARRNQARICGALGVEHVIVSADIPENRHDINKYVSAWLKKPHLGMVPLFMSGDKKYFNSINEVSTKYGTDLIVWGAAPYEFTHFKTGFAGIKPEFSNGDGFEDLFDFSNINSKLKLSMYYFKQVAANPYYWNKSILKGLLAFKDSYLSSKNYLYFYDYEIWDEDLINKTLIEEYNWETDPSIPSSWRIGDGTAPFYNFIYKSLAGFTEHDTFRNNQVLAGVLNREDAFNIVLRENEPRFEKIEEYLDLINLDYDKTINRILEFRIDS